MTVAALWMPLAPSAPLAVLLGLLHALAFGALAVLDPPVPLLVAAGLAMAAQACTSVRRDALGSAPGAPMALELRADGTARLARRGQPATTARILACSVRFPGIAVLALAGPEGRVGVLVTPGRVGAQSWRRLQVMARWGLDPGLSRRPVNSPGPGRSVSP